MKRNLPNGLYFKIMGYLLTATWVAYVLFSTKGNPDDELFSYIFIVPLAGWMLGKVIAYLMSRKPA